MSRSRRIYGNADVRGQPSDSPRYGLKVIKGTPHPSPDSLASFSLFVRCLLNNQSMGWSDTVVARQTCDVFFQYVVLPDNPVH